MDEYEDEAKDKGVLGALISRTNTGKLALLLLTTCASLQVEGPCSLAQKSLDRVEATMWKCRGCLLSKQQSASIRRPNDLMILFQCL